MTSHSKPTEDFETRFRKICGMMTSDHIGERATAAHLATQMLKSIGLTWADVSVNHINTQQRRQEKKEYSTYQSYKPQARREPDSIEIEVELIVDREKSVLVEYNDKQYWLPKSQITVISNNDPFYRISVPYWLAKAKEII